jgi:hypothetical protein
MFKVNNNGSVWVNHAVKEARQYVPVMQEQSYQVNNTQIWLITLSAPM